MQIHHVKDKEGRFRKKSHIATVRVCAAAPTVSRGNHSRIIFPGQTTFVKSGDEMNMLHTATGKRLSGSTEALTVEGQRYHGSDISCLSSLYIGDRLALCVPRLTGSGAGCKRCQPKASMGYLEALLQHELYPENEIPKAQ